MLDQNQRFNGGNGNTTAHFGYSPASQITSKTRDNDDYAFTGSVNVNRTYVTNGLNQYTSGGPAIFTYDVNADRAARYAEPVCPTALFALPYRSNSPKSTKGLMTTNQNGQKKTIYDTIRFSTCVKMSVSQRDVGIVYQIASRRVQYGHYREVGTVPAASFLTRE